MPDALEEMKVDWLGAGGDSSVTRAQSSQHTWRFFLYNK